MRPRRDSRLNQSFRAESYTRAGPIFANTTEGPSPLRHRSGQRQQHRSESDNIEEDEEEEMNDRTPLIASHYTSSPPRGDYGTDFRATSYASRQPRTMSFNTTSSPRALSSRGLQGQDRDYDVNNPPSVPGSPKDMGYDDAMVTGLDFPPSAISSDVRRDSLGHLHDAVIDIDGHGGRKDDSSPPSPHMPPPDSLQRRHTIALPAEEDVCFPTELAEEYETRASRDETGGRRRRRRREWPELSVLEEWSREEKEERSGEFRVKKISEPVLVGGRLRPQYAGWRREEEDAPYRFTYFNEDFQSTIHAQTISELVQPGGSFRELFIPDPPELEDSSSDEDEDLISLSEAGVHQPANNHTNGNHSRFSNGQDPGGNRVENDSRKDSQHQPNQFDIRSDTDASFLQQIPRRTKPKRYGPRPTWWLDVLSPTDAEMRVIAKAFGIHALTAEDIMMQEAREKVELFRQYYFLNYRTFEQDSNSEDYLEPVNMYVVVFREGVLSFHFSQTPHPANVRRRIRQLRDYLILSSDWICYALIDDITDVFGPLIQSIENEVDDVDDSIMQMHSRDAVDKEFPPHRDNTEDVASGGDMLRRVGECRKKVMGMYRLLSNKADVIKGFAKRCNEQWEVAPKSEIGLYLGDIQDHIMTMTSNLTHYET
jgi:magnesium transporter